MEIKTLCLGLLCAGDASGYDLKKQFESTFKHFYPAGYGSIYPSLADLANRGLVTCQEMPQEKKPDRKVYRITSEGREAFRAALHDADPHHKLRSEYLVAMYFADFLDPERLEEMLTGWRETLGHGVTRLDTLEQDAGEDAPAGTRFVLGFGKAIARAMAQYIEENGEMLTTPERPHETPGASAANNIEKRHYEHS
ncbi:MAG: PadR family transcriptional regulator [Gammaproteobacteria bacterium]|nr:PadR family transcriptional regulator [Gammaproteobacteria bacterium]